MGPWSSRTPEDPSVTWGTVVWVKETALARRPDLCEAGICDPWVSGPGSFQLDLRATQGGNLARPLQRAQDGDRAQRWWPFHGPFSLLTLRVGRL